MQSLGSDRRTVHRVLWRLLALIAVVVMAGTAAVTPAAADERHDPVDVQLVSLTDFHGYLGEYGATIVGSHRGDPAVRVGGGSYLATHVKRLREGRDNSLLFSVGDDFSGWPDETEWFWNEPTIEYLNALGLQFSTVGNHEMDRGFAFLRHMREGTCEGRPDRDLCFRDSSGQRFAGADYEYYSANLLDRSTGRPALKPYHVQQVDDGRGGTLPVGFVHATTALTSGEPMSYTPSGYSYGDEVKAINRSVERLRARGVRAIVAVVHEGFSQQNGNGHNDCVDPFGPVVDYNRAISPAVDAIVTGHWHATVNCMLPDPAGNPRPVVEAGNHGHLVNEINLKLDPRTGEVLRQHTTSVNHAVTQDVPRDAEADRIAAYWRGKLGERAAKPIGSITGDITRARDAEGESALYDVAADAYRWAADRDGRADLGLAMPDTLRRDLTYAPAPGNSADAPGRVLFPEAAVGTVADSGIGVGVVRGTLTGRELVALLESQWQSAPDGSVTFRPVAVSGNVSYRFDADGPVGERIERGSVRIDGRRVADGRKYRVATLATAFMEQRALPGFEELVGARDQDRSAYMGGDALWHYLSAHPRLAPPALDRARAS
ncbi:bifunctional metallophosphatase/5'-nucleotidase [Streptomyces sp. AN-3]|uniref:bifunctional metallophosphatase/5'-nucleotidase n=1 Tax=Streptomyces sp. AN-3 TaxID=3044177 RepID=UPI00249B4DEB|nr:bifunctional metallophosphatase/5'-nucleotidase [Streptomyces sp. AN-3]MDI3096480.1 bifunctional metallophosphatase/5'-nucleotidase [Streptomyces sp. AN-3]